MRRSRRRSRRVQVPLRSEPLRPQLTPRELQVALLVADGATNREAAASLFLTVKTIEFHLGHIYPKLGVRSRTELARRLATAERDAVPTRLVPSGPAGTVAS